MISKKTLGMVCKVLNSKLGVGTDYSSVNRIKKHGSSQKDSKKGFTLVELIVVLVIIAVLAAAIAPALLGFIDESNRKTYIEEAKSALAATETMMSDVYTDNLTYISSDKRAKAKEVAQADNATQFVIGTVDNFTFADGTYKSIECYTINTAIYKTKDGHFVCLKDGEWTVYDSAEFVQEGVEDADKQIIADIGANIIYVWPYEEGNGKYASDTANSTYVTAEGEDKPDTPKKKDKMEEPSTEVDGEPTIKMDDEIIVTLTAGNDGFVIKKKADGSKVDSIDVIFSVSSGASSGEWATSVSNSGAVDKNGVEYEFDAKEYYRSDSLSWFDVAPHNYTDIGSSDLNNYLTTLVDKGVSSTVLRATRDEITKDIPLIFVASSNKYQTVTVSDSTSQNKDRLNIHCKLASGEYTITASAASTDAIDFSGNASDIVTVSAKTAGDDSVHDARFYDDTNNGKPSRVDGKWIIQDPESANSYIQENNENTEKTLDEIDDWVSSYVDAIKAANADNVDAALEEFDALATSGITFEARADVHKKILVKAKESEDNISFNGQPDEITLEFSQIEKAKFDSDSNGVFISPCTSDEKEIDVNTYSLFNPGGEGIESGAAALTALDGTVVKFFDDKNSYKDSNSGTHKIREWEIYDSDISLTYDETEDPRDITKDWDCSNLLLPNLFAANYNYDGEVAIVDADLFRSLFVVDNRDYPTEMGISEDNSMFVPCLLNQKLRELIEYPTPSDAYETGKDKPSNTYNRKINSIRIISKEAALASDEYAHKCREVCLSETKIKVDPDSSEGFLLREKKEDGTLGDYVIEEYDDDYLAYIVGYSYKRADNTYDIYIFNEVDEPVMKAAGNLQNLFRNFSRLDGSAEHPNMLMTSIDAADVTNTNNMFKWNSMTEIILPNFDISSSEHVRSMFSECENLTTVKIGAGEYLNTASAQNFREMFCRSPYVTTVGGCGLNGTGVYLNISNGDNFQQMLDGSAVTDVHYKGDGSTLFAPSNTKDIYRDLTLNSVSFDNLNIGNREKFVSFVKLKNSFSSATLNRITLENATDEPNSLRDLFNGCSNLTHVTLDEYTMGQVRNGTAMFMKCGFTNIADIEGLDTKNVVKFHAMFSGCSAMHWNTSDENYSLRVENAEIMTSVFNGCSSLEEVKYSGDGTTLFSASDFKDIYNGCSNLTTVSADNIKVGKRSAIVNLFKYDSNLTNASLSNIDLSEADEPNSLKDLFNGCSHLTDVTFDKATMNGVTNMSYMFRNCYSLVSPEHIVGLDTTDVENMSYMFNNCTSFTGYKGGTNESKTFDTSFVFRIDSATNISFMFNGCSNLEMIKLKGAGKDTSVIQLGNNNGSIFAGTKLTDFELSDITIKGMTQSEKNQNPTGGLSNFFGAKGGPLARVTIKNASFPDIKSLDYVLYMHKNLEEVTFDNVDMVNLIRMKAMMMMVGNENDVPAATATGLRKVTFNKFNAPNVTNFSWVFTGCLYLTEVNMGSYGVEGSFKLEKVADFGGTFQHCRSLTSLDLTAVNTNSTFNTNKMFRGCTNLEYIYVTEATSSNGNYGFKKSKISSTQADMFTNCNALSGHNGTTYANKKVNNATFALVDRPGQEGYFTQKSGN